MTATIEASAGALAYQGYIEPAMWERLTKRIVGDLEFQQHFGELDIVEQQRWAERIMNEAVAFLLFVAEMGKSVAMESASPAKLPDIGWHNFLEHSPYYWDWCFLHAGRFIHHNPLDDGTASSGRTPAQTMAAMVKAGYTVDVELWTGSGTGECQGDGGNCDAAGGRCEPTR